MLNGVDKQVILVFKQAVIVETMYEGAHICNLFASFFTIWVLFHEHS